VLRRSLLKPGKGDEFGDVLPTDELPTLEPLTANWRSVIEGDTLPLFSR
jgi:hypothetical protein